MSTNQTDEPEQNLAEILSMARNTPDWKLTEKATKTELHVDDIIKGFMTIAPALGEYRVLVPSEVEVGKWEILHTAASSELAKAYIDGYKQGRSDGVEYGTEQAYLDVHRGFFPERYGGEELRNGWDSEFVEATARYIGNKLAHCSEARLLTRGEMYSRQTKRHQAAE
jgi:hypothetical protein